MRTQNPNDEFYITMSKWKVWAYVILCWALALIPLLPILLLIEGMLSGRETSPSDIVLRLIICGPLFLLFAAIGAVFLKKLGSPVASLSRSGFSGVKNLRSRSFIWTPNTVIYGAQKGSLILANLDAGQSRASKLWGGPKAAVVIHNAFAQQSRQEVLDAINKLSPYPVTQTTMWRAAK